MTYHQSSESGSKSSDCLYSPPPKKKEMEKENRSLFYKGKEDGKLTPSFISASKNTAAFGL